LSNLRRLLTMVNRPIRRLDLLDWREVGQWTHS
jgi:hypothetical protein